MPEITYFVSAGESNTRQTLEIAFKRWQQGGIDAIVIASTYGDSAELAAQLFGDSGAHLLVVGEVHDGKQSPETEICRSLEARGHKVIWGMPMGAMSAFTREQTAVMVADTLRRVSEGFKVVCEITLIATTLGFIQPGNCRGFYQL
jgi:hypothetical protein